MPELQQEIVNPPGMNPVDLARMQTEAQQGAGGTQAAAVGEGALLAGRTKNPGTAAAAIGEASRGANEELSKGALRTRIQNALLKEHQRQAGLTGMENLNREQTGASIGALGQVAPNVEADTKAQEASYNWARFIMGPILAAAGGAAPTIGQAFGLPAPGPR